MADANAFYEPEDDELLSSLAVPAYQSGVDRSYDEEYRRLQELEQHAYAQQAAAEQQVDQAAQLALVPDDVKKVGIYQMMFGIAYITKHIQFIALFHQAILENDLPTVTNLYESGWNKLTEVTISPS
jgi:translation initiation factor 3 subunit L